MANEISRTSVAETVPTEEIPRFVQNYRYAPTLMGLVAWTENVPQGSGGVFRWPRWDVVTPNAGVKTESTGVFANFEATTAEEGCTAGVVGVALDLSREAQYDSRAGLPRSLIDEGMRAMQNRLESDTLANITGATSTIGGVATVMTVAHLAAGLGTFELTNPPDSNIAVIMAPFQWRDLTTDAIANAAGIFTSLDLGELNAGVPGFKGRILGANIFVTANVATETTGRNAVITGMGSGKSGLGIAVWQRTQAERDPVPTRFADVYVLSARYGTTLTNNDSTRPNVTELISRAS